MAFKSPDDVPFSIRRRYLSLSPGDAGLDLADGFSALLLPTPEPGRTQWRLFARSRDGATLYSYAIPRLTDAGSISRDRARRSRPGAAAQQPEAEARDRNRNRDRQPAAVPHRPCCGARYQRLERWSVPRQRRADATANRIFLSCPATTAPAAPLVDARR